jgi:hypothetical protein
MRSVPATEGIDLLSFKLVCIIIYYFEWRHAIETFSTSFDLQLDAQNSYLFTYNTFIKILYMLLCSSSGGLRRNCIQGVPGGKDLTSGECSLGQTIPI